MKMKELANKYIDEAIMIRHKIHQFPELGFEEIETSKTVIEFLEKHNISYKGGIAKTGILATIKGSLPGKTVLLRADMDALELEEDENHLLRSLVSGKMHACGHDGHTAGLALAGAILNEVREQLHGTVHLMFQPAEETLGGAYPMILEGVLSDVDGAFGCHLMGHVLENHAETLAGPMMAAPDEFNITITGHGGHGGMPHTTVDPIVVAAHVVIGLQSIVSRMSDPFDPVVVSVGKMHAGTAFNIIPNHASITGTVRTLNEITRHEVEKRIRKISTSIAQAFDAQADVNYERRYPVLINDEVMVSIAKNAFKKIVPSQNVNDLEKPTMGGEDFAYIAQHVPSAFVFVGIAKDREHPIPHHHPSFDFDDKNIEILGSGLAQMAWDFLNESN